MRREYNELDPTVFYYGKVDDAIIISNKPLLGDSITWSVAMRQRKRYDEGENF